MKVEDCAKRACNKALKKFDNILGKNTLLEMVDWKAQARIKGTPEYYERIERENELLNERIDTFNSLPWYKKLFKRI